MDTKHLLPYEHDKGYSVKEVPNGLFKLLDKTISAHIGLKNLLSEYKREDSKVLRLEVSKELQSRESRTVPKEIVREISQDIIDYLSTIMPRPVRLHNNDIYCRIVIPEMKQTVSVPHRDCYFHQITPGWKFTDREESLKVWIPLYCPSDRALGVIKGSHLSTDDYSGIFYFDGKNIGFNSPHTVDQLEAVTVPCRHCLIFPSTLVHGALPSEVLDRVRVSVEISPVIAKQ